MRCGICLCGLNGCGKTTLAKALAETLGFKHLDIENYYFTVYTNLDYYYRVYIDGTIEKRNKFVQ